jgi:hypothetical protein
MALLWGSRTDTAMSTQTTNAPAAPAAVPSPSTAYSRPSHSTAVRTPPRRLGGGLTPNCVSDTSYLPLRNQWPHHSARARLALATRTIRDLAAEPCLTWSTLPGLLEEAVLTHAPDLAQDGLQRRDVRVGATMAGHVLQYWLPAALHLTSAWVEDQLGTDDETRRALTPTSLGRIVAWGDRRTPQRRVLLDLMHYTHLRGAILDPWVAHKSATLEATVARVLPGTEFLGIRLLAPLASASLHQLPGGSTHPLGQCSVCAFRTVQR